MAAEDNVLPLTTLSSENLESAMQISSKAPPAAPSHPQPHQPHSFLFSKRMFGKKTGVLRAFQAKWFDSYSWLHYDEANIVAFCYLHTSPALATRSYQYNKLLFFLFMVLFNCNNEYDSNNFMLLFGWPDHCEEASDAPEFIDTMYVVNYTIYIRYNKK